MYTNILNDMFIDTVLIVCVQEITEIYFKIIIIASM